MAGDSIGCALFQSKRASKRNLKDTAQSCGAAQYDRRTDAESNLVSPHDQTTLQRPPPLSTHCRRLYSTARTLAPWSWLLPASDSSCSGSSSSSSRGCPHNPNPGQRPHAPRPVRARQFPPHRSHINNRSSSDKPSHVSPEGLGPNLEPLPRAAAQATD